MSDLLSNWETVIPHLTEVFRNKIGLSEQELVIIDLNFDNLVDSAGGRVMIYVKGKTSINDLVVISV